MTHTTTAAALAACGILLGSTAAHGTGADGAYPLKNRSYTTSGTYASVGYSAQVTIKIGDKVTKVKKLVATISCAEGSQKIVKKNLGIDEYGYIDWDERWSEDFFGQFTSRHKVDRVAVQGAGGKPCSEYVVELPDAKDR